MKFEQIVNDTTVHLYLGDLDMQRRTFTRKKFIGLSLTKNDDIHIQHDVTKPYELKDNSVDSVQSEDVMEHIEYDSLKGCINEIYRILKPGGLFRLSMPTYECDILYNRSKKDKEGNIVFDAGGGGSYDNVNKKVIRGGHVWFPTYHTVKQLLLSTNFDENKIDFLHYYDEEKRPVLKTIDYSLGYISRTPDNDSRVQNPRRPMSIVIDCYK